MFTNNLEITRNENFEVEFIYKDKKSDGQDFNINIEDFTVVWEVLYYNTDTEAIEIMIPDTDYSTTNSILKNGVILIEMSSSQTGAIPDNVSSVPWTLYIENVGNDEKYNLMEGRLRISDWVTY